MILIMPDTLVLLARITAQVSASKVSATMTVNTHQQQVFLQALSVIGSKLMPFPLLAPKPTFLLTYILVGIWESLYEYSHLLVLTESRGVKILKVVSRRLVNNQIVIY